MSFDFCIKHRPLALLDHLLARLPHHHLIQDLQARLPLHLVQDLLGFLVIRKITAIDI